MSTRVRYQRDALNRPKNCLVSIQRGDWIYFGISRCNTRFDLVRKKQGRLLAESRAAALLAADTDATHLAKEPPAFIINSDKLSGVCHVSFVKLALVYFDEIEFCFKNNVVKHT